MDAHAGYAVADHWNSRNRIFPYTGWKDGSGVGCLMLYRLADGLGRVPSVSLILAASKQTVRCILPDPLHDLLCVLRNGKDLIISSGLWYLRICSQCGAGLNFTQSGP